MASSLLRLRENLNDDGKNDDGGFETLVDIGCGLGYLEEELRMRMEEESSGRTQEENHFRCAAWH